MLELDTDALQTAFAADAAGATSLLNQAALSFDALVDAYATGGGTIEMASKPYEDNALYLEGLIPGLQEIGALTEQYSAAQYARSVARIYASSLNESLFESFPTKAFSVFA